MELLVGIVEFIGDVVSALALAPLSHFHDKQEQE